MACHERSRLCRSCVSREVRGFPGHRPSPRTGQILAKVLPHVSDESAGEARRRGVTRGVLIEEAWAVHCAQQGR